MKKLALVILSFCLMISTSFLFAGCAENADVITESNLPEFGVTMEEIESVHQAYSNFMNEGEGDIYYRNSDGFTPDEIPCYATYIESADGAYKVCTLTASRDDIESVYDEYTFINENTLFIVRSYITADNEIVIDKYVVIDNVLYSINEDEEVFELVERPDSLGFYLSFSELVSLYGADAE